jgi:pimeloyl-ACP methyl ester carboxylesterase
MKYLLGIVIVALSVMPVRSQTKKVTYGNNPQAGHYLTTRGVNLYYELYGEGEPLLMIHGNNGSMASFSNQIPYFAQRYKVIAVDSRAQGKSFDARDSLSFEMMADDFNTLLDSLHIPSCRVLGWSDGGINALILAIRHPEKVKMIASTGANLWPDSTAVTSACWNDMLKEAEELKHKAQTSGVKNTRKLLDLDLYQPHITQNQLSKLRCPALIIGGDHDIIRTEHTKTIAEYIPDARLWIVPNSGHATLIQHKELFNKTVEAFFSKKSNK